MQTVRASHIDDPLKTPPFWAALVVLLLQVGLQAQESLTDAPSVIEVTASDYTLEVPDTIPSGWVTIELRNRGEEPHFLELGALPERAGWKDVQKAYAGAIDTAGAWWSSIDFVGGVGLVGPGRTARTSLPLPPGTYHLFCFVRDSTGTPHDRLRAGTQLVVTRDSSTAGPPEPDVGLTLADYEIMTEGQLRTGRQTVAVHFGKRPDEGEPPYQDVHLARLEEGQSVQEVAQWMARRHAPAPAAFLGGTPAMAPGTTIYLTVDLKPGRYVWVSDASAEKETWKGFTVA